MFKALGTEANDAPGLLEQGAHHHLHGHVFPLAFQGQEHDPFQRVELGEMTE